MDHGNWQEFAILTGGVLLIVVSTDTACARQNILVGDLSVGYELRERDYDERSIPEAEGQAGDEAVGAGTEVIFAEDRAEDRNRYFLEPRLTLTSTGITDEIALTYAPRINFEEDDSTNHIDHDFGLLADKNFSRAWSVSFSDNFFLGDDALRESDARTAVIGSPAEGEEEEADAPIAGEEDLSGLTERVDSRRFWRNDLELSTDYVYKEDSIVGAGFSCDMLRNVDDDIGGYTEYDRYDGMLSLSYRFSQQWHAEVEGHYIRGIFDDEAEAAVVRVSPAEEDIDVEGEDAEEDIGVEREDVNVSGDLDEYDLLTSVIYDWTRHDNLLADYHFLGTEYDHPLRDDSRLHEVSLGWNHDFTSQLRLTVSGGPSFLKRENSSLESDYNAYAGLTKDFFHSSLSVYGEKGYDQESFDGRRSGLTDFWRVGADYSYQFTENLAGTLTGAYRNSRREEPPAADAVVILEGEDSGAGVAVLPEDFEYTDEFYDAGASLSYSFMRWYSVTGGYRYLKRDSDLAGSSNYDEHLFFITLTASRELFRW